MRWLRAGATVVVVVFALAAGAGLGAAAHEEPDRTDIFGVELEPDGDATVYHVTAYDLGDDQQRQQYESVADNETAKQEWRRAVTTQLERAAETGREATGGNLEMEVSNVSLRTETVVDDGGDEPERFGRVEVTAEWEHLAYHSGAFDLEGVADPYVVVIEPFSEGYEPSHVSLHPVGGPLSRVSIHGPEGYERSTRSAPDQLRAQRNSMLWNPLTSNFSNFYALYTGTGGGATGGEGATDGQADQGTPDGEGGSSGAGVALRALVFALVAAAVVVLALRQRE
jgi:hypothetical protein